MKSVVYQIGYQELEQPSYITASSSPRNKMNTSALQLLPLDSATASSQSRSAMIPISPTIGTTKHLAISIGKVYVPP
jgi:hypothetical protein